MTPGEYLELWRSQNQQCSICGISINLYHKDTHVHLINTRKVLLCTDCDQGLTSFKNDENLLRRGATLVAPLVTAQEKQEPLFIAIEPYNKD